MNELKMPYNLTWVNVERNENKKSDFRKISPRSTLPVLEVSEDFAICESNAIIQYLESVEKEKSFSSGYKEPKDYASAMMRIQEIDRYLYSSMKHFTGFYKRSEESSYVKFEKLLEELDRFNDYLERKNYLRGEEKGLDDICLFPILFSLTKHYGVDLNLFQFPNLKRYVKNFDAGDLNTLLQPSENMKIDLKKYQKDFVNKGYGRELLPQTIKISKYDVTLEPDMEKFEFSGDLDIHLQFLEDTSEIVLNSKNIEIIKVEAKTTVREKIEEEEEEEGEGECTTSKHEPYMIDYDVRKEWVSMYFDTVFRKDTKATVSIKYTGKIGSNMTGLYRSKYTNSEGEVKHMAVTQFESVGARLCLPCIDEPAHKAVFECKLVLADEYDGLSNMDVVKTSKTADKKNILHFAPSVPMSTYLLAFAVMLKSDYGYVEQYTTEGGLDGKGGLRVRVYSLKKEDGRFALETVVKGIPLYENYFEEKFPLMKLDLLCVSEFAAGAMENWGLITFRETAILVSENSAASTKQRVAVVVTHEVAHMWFGNLVTMEWWVDLWLNEGFAVWCEYFIADQLYPEMKLWNDYVTSDFVRALSADSLESSHPIEVHVTKAEQIDEIFDSISYLKGCAIVRMVVDFLGIEVFRKGICKYLQEYRYGNACTRNLWAILERESGKDVQGIMEGWTKQTGYPFVKVTLLEEKEDELILELSQKRFLSTGIQEEDETVWPVPISYKVNQAGKVGETQKVLMGDPKMKIHIPLVSGGGKLDWVFFNPGLTGFYKVLYDEKLFGMLTKDISSLEELDKFAIQNDYVDFTKVGLMDLSMTMDLLRCFKNEESYSVINGISTSIAKLYNLVKYDAENSKLFHKFGQELFSNLKSKYGVLDKKSGEFSHVEIHLQSLVVSNLLTFLDEGMVKLALEYFENKQDQISPDLLDHVYSTTVKRGGEKGFEAVKKIFMDSDKDEVKVRCLRALGKSDDVETMKSALEWMMTDDVKDQDKIYLFVSTAFRSVPFGRDVAWEFFKQNIDKIKEKFSGGMMMPYFVQYSILAFNDEDKIPEIEEFFGNHTIPGCGMSLTKGIEGIKVKSKWIKKDKGTLVEWLKKNFGE